MSEGPLGGAPATVEDDGAVLQAIDFACLPRHVGVIMDGNGRWAKKRGLPRVAGHRAGIAAVRDIVDASVRLGLEVLTVYAFSRENWSRPPAEVSALMGMLKEYLESELRSLHEKNIRLKTIGRLEDLVPSVREAILRAVDLTRDNTGMTFVVALSYSGRGEILEACREIARDAAAGRIDPETLDEPAFSARLGTRGLPDPDLLIRTSGELRISNFLLWQLAYTELWVTPLEWPDFRRRHLWRAIVDFQARERRFGGIGPTGAPEPTAGQRRPDPS